MFHRSDRLLLRPVWPEDWRNILVGIADEGVVRNLASAPWPYNAEDARAFTALPANPRFPRFLITRAADARLIGCIGIDPSDAVDDGAELGYWIARNFWGQGFASEAACAVVHIARMIGHERLLASHFLDNPASGKVLRKIGFVPTGSVAMRHSCGRDTKAPTTEYLLELDVPAWQSRGGAAAQGHAAIFAA
jgi:RimJ/RimL family protein N-acetyltransferase